MTLCGGLTGFAPAGRLTADGRAGRFRELDAGGRRVLIARKLEVDSHRDDGAQTGRLTPARRPAVGRVRSVGSRPAAGRAGGGVEQREAGRRTDRAESTRDARGPDRTGETRDLF
jgi:hypothetical protein